MAARHPDLVRHLVLFEPAISATLPESDRAAGEAAGAMFDPVTKAVDAGDVDKAAQLLIDGVFHLRPGDYEREAPLLREMHRDNARTMPLLWQVDFHVLTCDDLKGFGKPTLVVHGETTDAWFSHVAEQTAACLPQGELVVQPGVNHDGPVHDPAELATLVETFVARN